MSSPHRYDTYVLPSFEINLVNMLRNYKFMFMSSKGTQTDPEIFYVNGKPARAVKPFRVVLKPEIAQAVDVESQTQPPQLEMQDEEQNASGMSSSEQHEVQQAEALQHEMQQLEVQLSVLRETQPQEPEVQEQYWPESELESHGTQTELNLLHNEAATEVETDED